jgi:hypothetical protein
MARARGQLDADAVGFLLVLAAVGQHEHGLGEAACKARIDVDAGEDRERNSAERRRRLRRHLPAHALARVLEQRVRDLVAHHGPQLVLGQLELLDQPGVDGDLSARHAPGVDLIGGEDVDFPLPGRSIIAKNARLWG